jgi:DNA-binding transcriptional regulator YdaS (Cro superfamily)
LTKGWGYGMKDFEARFVIGELRTLVSVAGSQVEAARRLGMSESWLRGVLTGRRTHITFATAQHIHETVRGGRNLDHDFRKAEQAKKRLSKDRERRARA